MLVHRLVAIAEFGFEEVCGHHVHHKNGVKWDNRPENLELMTESEHNSHHKKGEKNPKAKMDVETAEEIRREYEKDGVYQKHLADEYDVNQSVISRIVNDERWAK